MHTRRDLNFQRGYEWWLMTEAKKRNPKIILDSLAWGAPGWIGDGKYYSQDMADYVVKFIQGARNAHGLDIAFTGVWNEKPYDSEWIKLLRRTLDASGLQSTKIVAADLYQQDQQWDIVKKFAGDPALDAAVYAVGVHYARTKGKVNTPQFAKDSGKRLWSTEDQPEFGENGAISSRDWEPGGKSLAQIYNWNYIDGRMTKTEIWSPVTSYYDNLAAPNSGLMYANTPWSGHYDVQSTIWVTAHTTQFAQPGWHYIDEACGYLAGKGKLCDFEVSFVERLYCRDRDHWRWIAAACPFRVGWIALQRPCSRVDVERQDHVRAATGYCIEERIVYCGVRCRMRSIPYPLPRARRRGPLRLLPRGLSHSHTRTISKQQPSAVRQDIWRTRTARSRRSLVPPERAAA